MKMKNKIISVLLLMAIVLANISVLNPQNTLAADMDYSVEYNHQEITDSSENITDVYIVDVQQSVPALAAASTSAVSKSGTWIKESNGKWWYKHTDGTYTKNDWEYINGKWYHFDSNGYMQLGWLKVGDYWYHLDYETGAMATGWKYVVNGWYYFGTDGVRRTGWQKIDNEWYHLNTDGIMDTGWKYVYNGWYYFGSDGVRRTGWQKIDNKWYHLNTDGIMDTEWKYVYNGWYYFGSDGVRRTGWLSEGGYKYYLNSDGIMQISWQQISGKWYHFDAKGHMDIGWHYIGNGWYYFENSGVMRTQPITIGTRKYEFRNDGRMYITELLVKEQKQEKTNCCWAAASVMVGTYNNNSTVTQSDVVKHVKGSAMNVGGVETDEGIAIRYASNKTKKIVSYKKLELNEVISEIDGNRPFTIRMKWSGIDGHSVVCAGYKLLTDNNDVLIRIIDPDYNSPTDYFRYSDLMSEITLHSGKGTCRGMISFEYK